MAGMFFFSLMQTSSSDPWSAEFLTRLWQKSEKSLTFLGMCSLALLSRVRREDWYVLICFIFLFFILKLILWFFCSHMYNMLLMLTREPYRCWLVGFLAFEQSQANSFPAFPVVTLSYANCLQLRISCTDERYQYSGLVLCQEKQQSTFPPKWQLFSRAHDCF